MKPETRYFILVADKETWLTALIHNIWGFTEKTKGLWNTSNVGDYVAFYVTSPTKKIIGYGRIITKYFDEGIVWPDEKVFNKPIWKYRIGFKRLYLIDNWENGVSIPPHIILKTGRISVNKQAFYKFLSQVKEVAGSK
jgi:predicted RNA-binding protein